MSNAVPTMLSNNVYPPEPKYCAPAELKWSKIGPVEGLLEGMQTPAGVLVRNGGNTRRLTFVPECVLLHRGPGTEVRMVGAALAHRYIGWGPVVEDEPYPDSSAQPGAEEGRGRTIATIDSEVMGTLTLTQFPPEEFWGLEWQQIELNRLLAAQLVAFVRGVDDKLAINPDDIPPAPKGDG